MQIIAYRLRPLVPPRDSLLNAIAASKILLKEKDIVAISSKVVSIDEGRTVLSEGIDKEKLVRQEASHYLKIPTSRHRQRFTIAKGGMAGAAGIDESNGSGHYVLYPEDPFLSAQRLRKVLMKKYRLKKLGVIITDSTSVPLRRGAIGFALSWDGIDPLRDYRGTPDIFGRLIKVEMANLVDALAASAVFEMGEGSEQTPIAVIRSAKNIHLKNRSRSKDQLMVSPEDDLFAPLLFHKSLKWKRNTSSS